MKNVKLTTRGEWVVAIALVVGAWLIMRGMAWGFYTLDMTDGVLDGRF